MDYGIVHAPRSMIESYFVLFFPIIHTSGDSHLGMTIKSFQQFRDELPVQIIIAVNKADIFTSCYLQACIASSTQSPVGLMNNPYTIIYHGVFIANFSTLVGRTVINKNNLQVPISLSDDTVNAFFQIFLHIIYRNNDRN